MSRPNAHASSGVFALAIVKELVTAHRHWSDFCQSMIRTHIIDHIQKLTTAAREMADMKVWVQR
jgi:hypothetical protein